MGLIPLWGLAGWVWNQFMFTFNSKHNFHLQHNWATVGTSLSLTQDLDCGVLGRGALPAWLHHTTRLAHQLSVSFTSTNSQEHPDQGVCEMLACYYVPCGETDIKLRTMGSETETACGPFAKWNNFRELLIVHCVKTDEKNERLDGDAPHDRGTKVKEEEPNLWNRNKSRLSLDTTRLFLAEWTGCTLPSKRLIIYQSRLFYITSSMIQLLVTGLVPTHSYYITATLFI